MVPLSMRAGWWRAPVALAVFGCVAVSGCSNPSDFRGLDNTCDLPNFDVRNRDQHCSGNFSSQPFVQISAVTEEEGSAPALNYSAGWLSSFQSLTFEDRIRVLVSYDRDEMFENYILSSFEIDGELGAVTAGAVMGLESEFDEPRQHISAVVQDNNRLSFFSTNPVNQFGSVTIRVDEFGLDDATRAMLESSCPNIPELPDDPDAFAPVDQSPFFISDVEPISSDLYSYEFLLVAARCALFVVANPSFGFDPQVVAVLPVPAQDLIVDRERDRVYVAAGRAGGQIVALGPLLERSAAEAGSPRCVCTSDPCGDCTPEPPILIDGLASAIVSSEENITPNAIKVGFKGERVYYINAATDPDDAFDSNTWAVMGELDLADGTLEDEITFPIDNNDFDFYQVNWDMALVGETLVAFLQNTFDLTDGGEIARNSRVLMVDAPKEFEPLPLLAIPLTRPVESLLQHRERLLLVQSDLVHEYTFTVEGELQKSATESQ